MAVETNPFKDWVLPSAPPAEGSTEGYFKTPEGQVAKRVLDAIEAGDMMKAEREYEAGQKLYGWTPRSAQQQAAPKAPVYNPPTRMLPQEYQR